MEQTKVCTKCHEVKPFTAFGPGRDRNKLRYDCRACHNALVKAKYNENPEASALAMREYRKAHPEQEATNRKKYHKTYAEKHGETLKQHNKEYFAKWSSDNAEYKTEYSRVYYAENKEKIKAQRLTRYYANKDEHMAYHKKYMLDRNRADINFRLAGNIRHRIYAAIKSNKRGGSAVKDLGITIPELKEYLALRFTEGMSWDNYGLWHVDHIKPLISFDLTDREQFLEAVHYTNLQPLWASENIHKGDKLPEPVV